MGPGALHLIAFPAVSGSHEFDVAALVLGAILVAGALLSGIAHRSFLSLAAVFVVAGFVLGPGVTGTLHFDARSTFVADLATVALIVILFGDGLEVDGEMLQRHWEAPLRKLVLAMPLTAIIVAAGAHLLTDLSWTESFLLGALLSPTDPAPSSSVVTNPRVPAAVRHSLNLESGINDGLALPAVLAFAAALQVGGGGFVLGALSCSRTLASACSSGWCSGCWPANCCPAGGGAWSVGCPTTSGCCSRSGSPS